MSVSDLGRARRFYEGALGFTFRDDMVVPDSVAGRLLRVEPPVGLTACYLVRVEQGAVSRLQFDVPEDLEPAHVAVRQQDAAGGPAALLRDWSFGPTRDRFRRLRVDLQSPAGGRLLVTLECSPRSAPTRQPTLRFPRAVRPPATPRPG